MTTLVLLLLLLVALCAAFALVLWRLLHPAPVLGAGPAQSRLAACPASERYKPVARLLLDDDFAFVAAQSNGCHRLVARLRRQRLRILRLYLKQMRGDFARVYGQARLLAPASQDPAFAGRMVSLALRFSVLWIAANAVSVLGWLGPARGQFSGLVKALDGLSEAVQASLPPAETPLALAPRM